MTSIDSHNKTILDSIRTEIEKDKDMELIKQNQLKINEHIIFLFKSVLDLKKRVIELENKDNKKQCSNLSKNRNKEYYLKNRQKILEYSRKYRQEHNKPIDIHNRRIKDRFKYKMSRLKSKNWFYE